MLQLLSCHDRRFAGTRVEHQELDKNTDSSLQKPRACLIVSVVMKTILGERCHRGLCYILFKVVLLKTDSSPDFGQVLKKECVPLPKHAPYVACQERHIHQKMNAGRIQVETRDKISAPTTKDEEFCCRA
uniref:Uncharacterized protein n=1 Tax=Rhipicephalus zambeziensis TaxID=60191 RepID=A0A224YF23_9ACAR